MGKRIISQARGHGSNTYRVRRNAYKYRLKYPKQLSGEGTVIKILNSPGHTTPIAKVMHNEGVFYIPAFKGMVESQKIHFNNEINLGNIVSLKHVPVKTEIYSIESRPGDGGVFIRTAGSFGTVNRIIGNKVYILMPSKKEKAFHPECRAIIGIIAGSGRLDKPILKAGKKHYMAKARNKLWPRTSALKMNAIDHPFGSGRGKNPKSKIAKRNVPPGAKVGHLRPRQTGKRK
jgi:large subunit ribosomal protein L2